MILGFARYDDRHKPTITEIVLHKISPDGYLVGGENGVTFSDDHYDLFLLHYIAPQPDDGCLIVFYKVIEDHPNDIVGLYVARINSTGTKVWSEDLVIRFGSITPSTQINCFTPSKGGVFITWDDYIDTPYAGAYLQYITPEGELWSPSPGIRLDVDNSVNQFHPRIVGINSKAEVITIWKQEDSFQNNPMLVGQKISFADGRLWGDNGKLLISNLDLDSNTAYTMSNDTIFIVYQYSEFPNIGKSALHLATFDQNGNECWKNPTIINSKQTYKKGTSLTDVNNYQMVVLFKEGDTFTNYPNLLAQNVFTNGQLGLRSTGIKQNPQAESIKVVYDHTSSILSINSIYEGKIFIRNQLGQIVYNDKIQEQIHLSHLSIGIYYIGIYNGNNRIFIQKMLLGN